MPNTAEHYLEKSWQAEVLRYWATSLHVQKLRYQYKLAKLLYYGNSSNGFEVINEIYDLLFFRREPPGVLSQQEMQSLIEEYERIFGKDKKGN